MAQMDVTCAGPEALTSLSKYQVFSVIFFVMFADDVVWRVIVVPIEASRPQGLTVSKSHFHLQSEKKLSRRSLEIQFPMPHEGGS
jgi:hypothetical protein